MAATKIEWANAVWNPITGCTPISESCDHCYAKRMANRLAGQYGYPADEPFRVTFHKDRLDEPLKWKKPKRIFVCSMGDLFHEAVTPMWVDMIMTRIRVCQQHTFMILTKRPERAVEMLNGNSMFVVDPNDHGNWKFDSPKNLWLGVTAENQARADERIPILLQIPAAVRFLSVEPMLGPVNLKLFDDYDPIGGLRTNRDMIDWVICGGETGPGARPMHPDWVRSLRDQCRAAEVPFFFKQWGEWYKPRDFEAWDGDKQIAMSTNGSVRPWTDDWSDDEVRMMRVGKNYAGRLIDGREWNEFPS